MKKFNKSLAITLILSLCLTLAVPVDAKSKVKLNITKATLSIGGSINLKLLNNKKKVTWKSSNKKVASVTKKGKVKAKKKGKASIVAKVGKKKYTCKVTVGSVSKVSKSVKVTKKPSVSKTAQPSCTPILVTMPPIPTKTPLIPSTAEFVEKEVTMKVGETRKLEVNLVRGTLYHSPFTGFISKNEKVATIENVTTNDNHACVVTAVSEGITQISFFSGAPECYCTITVISADDDTK